MTPHFRLHHLLEQQLPERADRIAIADDTGTWTYASLWSDTQALARHMRAAGVVGGDRVLVVGESSAAQLAAVFACSILDAWAVVANARLTAAELANIERHCGPRMVLATSSVSEDASKHALARAASAVAFGALSLHATPADAAAVAEAVEPNAADQVAVLIYTTGTTGAPKGVMLTHQNLGFSAAGSRAARATTSTDVVCTALPVSHVFGLTSVALAALGAGAQLKMHARFDAGQTMEALSEATFFHGVPAMYVRLTEMVEAGTPLRAPRLRFLHCGGAALDPSLKQRVERAFGLPICNGYGMTETSPTVSSARYGVYRHDLSVGYLVEGVQARIVDENGQPVAPGASGELQVRGPNVMKGYYRAPEQTQEVLLPDGWLRTGDILRQDPDGALFVMGRLKDLIIRSGFNVYPVEVEAVLNALPGVSQSCVVGREIEGDEQVIAFVESQPGVTLCIEALQAQVREKLVAYKRPQRIVVIDKLPAAQSGKILKHQVKQLAAQLPL